MKPDDVSEGCTPDDLQKHMAKLKEREKSLKLKESIPRQGWFIALRKIKLEQTELERQYAIARQKEEAEKMKCPPHAWEYKGLAKRPMDSVGITLLDRATQVCSKCGEVRFT